MVAPPTPSYEPMKHSRVIFFISAVLLAAGNVRAQLPDMQPLADQMAQAISTSKQASVVVIDFLGPDENFTQLVAGQLKIKSAVTGNISVTGNQVVVEVSLFRVDTRQWVKSFETSTVGSDETQTLIKTLIEDTASKFGPSVPIAGQNGYTHPVCSH